MTTEKASTRERLLDTAGRLFYEQGVGIGVEALCKAAGVSKRSMYQLFETKDEVLAAALERQGAALDALVMPPPGVPESPRARVLYVFEQLEAAAKRPDFLGCPYLGVQMQLRHPDHPASLVAARGKQGLAAFFRAEIERAGVADPGTLVRRLMVVYDGSTARAGIKADPLDEGLAVSTAALMLDAAGFPE
ncbi:TetR/AcrR family transcriptional regulator [Streptomyces sp. TS71-3]|uniref:TetR/AcrR family transcriptional regulator n=1 Tax=Streptomyces sp. TS71-3 TaxID=2733862 RepID=UPI001BB40CE0|nr:TetR/AcrR family transcriptional regulator [Streptomyces sp. TS71-3]